MKLFEIFPGSYRGSLGQRKKASDDSVVAYIEIEDPDTGDYAEIAVRGHFNYDDGDVGFGTGHGNSPYDPEWTLDFVEVEEPFTFKGKKYNAEDDIDLEDFARYFTQPVHSIEDLFPVDDLGQEDGGY